jgi:ATP-dependent Clp protease ATP-binding subunit ClpB
MIDLNRLTTQAQEAFVDAQTLLKRYEHNQLDNEHLFLALLEEDKSLVRKILTQLNVDISLV